jgi:hypothetical protein
MASPLENGQLTKLKFTAYKAIDFSEKNAEAGEYEVMFNPAAIAVKLQVDREESQGNGSTTSEMRFKKIKPQDFQFEFIIDGTGAVTAEKKSVPDEVERFLKVVYSYNGTTHAPNYVMVRYGAVLLKTVMKTVDVNYTLFKADGTPLRAKVTITLTSCVDQELSEMVNSKSSPDLTHKRTVKQTERLISMAYSIYDNNQYYLDVAKVNGLNSFRRVATGTDVFFPPLEKTTKNA